MAVFGYGWTGRNEKQPGRHSEEQGRMLERAGLAPAHWFADDCPGQDLAAAQRPQFQRLLGRLDRHDRLVVCTLDCLGRDARDIVSQVRALTARRVQVVVLQLGEFDLAGPAGRTILAALGAVADMAHSLPAGPAGAASLGAKPEARTRGRPVCTTQAQRTHIIQQHRAGKSISALARAANLSRASIMRIVRATSVQ